MLGARSRNKIDLVIGMLSIPCPGPIAIRGRHDSTKALQFDLADLLFSWLDPLAITRSIRIESRARKKFPAPRAPIFRFDRSRTMGLYGHLVIRLLLLAVCMIHGSYILVEGQNTSFRYLPFSSPNNFSTVGDVQYFEESNSFLLNSGAQALGIDTCGRLYYKDRVRMKDAASGAVASFNTSFTFSILGLNSQTDEYGYLHGDGMTFTFGWNNDSLVGVKGGWLCLVQAASNGQPSNQVFAVEFDTFRNAEFNDSSDNHIGVDVNSVNSTWSYNLCGGTLLNCSYLVNGGSFTAWIDYDSPSQKLDVYFANGSLINNIPGTILKPPKSIINETLPLTAIMDEYMYVGFTGSSAVDEVHQIQAWQFATAGLPEVVAMSNSGSNFSRGRKAGIIAGVCAGVGAVLLLAGIVIAKRQRRASHTKQGTKFNLVDQNLVPRVFTYKELSKATKNFSRSERLGSGGFGAVYKGVLPSGALVAVKRMRHESKQGEEGFQAEAASLSQIRHRNLVQLRGWCHEEEELMLVYDFMSNGGLDEWLFLFPERNGKARSSQLRLAESLPLMLRHSILSGVAAALAYLHEECMQCVLHRDIKSSNVLLDEDMNAYLGDFGLARLIDHEKMEKTTMMAGTLGYMAPEIPATGRATKESDVYGFGVLMLEVMCGMRPLDLSAIERGDGALVDRIWHAHETGNIFLLADPKLGTFPHPDADPYGGIEMQEASGLLRSEGMVDLNPSARHTSSAAMEDQKVVTNLLHLGLLCCHPNPEDRPSMRLVSQWLQASESMEMSLPSLPRCKPQAWYSRPGFSQMALIRSVSTSLNSDIVQDVG